MFATHTFEERLLMLSEFGRMELMEDEGLRLETLSLSALKSIRKIKYKSLGKKKTL